MTGALRTFRLTRSVMKSDLRPKLVIFDVDGTLIDSQGHIVASMAGAYHAIGQAPPARERVLSIVGLSLPVAMARLSPDLEGAQIATLVEAYKDTFGELRRRNDPLAASPLYPGARDQLTALSKRTDVLLGVATGKSRRGLDALLETHALTDWFVTTQVADDHPSKPHPSMLFSALAEAGVTAADAVMIGDTEYDIAMAGAADIASIGVSWGYHAADALHAAGAALVIDGFAQLPAALDAVWKGVIDG